MRTAYEKYYFIIKLGILKEEKEHLGPDLQTLAAAQPLNLQKKQCQFCDKVVNRSIFWLTLRHMYL